MTRYFAIIDSEKQGPFTLEELAAAGVRPDTYVWARGMDDWTRADEVGDICRYFRQRIAGVAAKPLEPPVAESPQEAPPEGRRPAFTRFPDLPDLESIRPDTGMPPGNLTPMAILSMLLCFPPTGIVALVFAMRSRKVWGRTESDPKDSAHLREQAHEYARQARMWIGITISLGMIFYAFLLSRF